MSDTYLLLLGPSLSRRGSLLSLLNARAAELTAWGPHGRTCPRSARQRERENKRITPSTILSGYQCQHVKPSYKIRGIKEGSGLLRLLGVSRLGLPGRLLYPSPSHPMHGCGTGAMALDSSPGVWQRGRAGRGEGGREQAANRPPTTPAPLPATHMKRTHAMRGIHTSTSPHDTARAGED